MTSSSISIPLLTWSVNQISTEENSVLTVFIIVKECREIFINCPNCLFGTEVNNTFDVCWKSFLTKSLKQLQQILILARFHRLCLYQRLFLCFLTILLFQEIAILICTPFLFSKQFCYWFYLDKFELVDSQSMFRGFGW